MGRELTLFSNVDYRLCVSRFASGTRELKKESPFIGHFLVFFWERLVFGIGFAFFLAKTMTKIKPAT